MTSTQSTTNPHHATSDLPTLGDRPGDPTTTPSPARRRRFGRKAALLASGAVVLASLGGTAAYAASAFSDVPDNHPFADQIGWMADNEIASGYPDGSFKPANNVSRQAAAAFIANYNDTISYKSTNSNLVGPAHVWVKTITCDEGKRPIGGGGSASAQGANVLISASTPTEKGWSMRFVTQNNVNISSGSSIVYVTCVPEAAG